MMSNDIINQIIYGDCLEVLLSIPDNSVDLSFADPPFNLRKKYNGYYDNLSLKAYIAWCEQWITEMVRITKPTGSIFIHNIPKWLTYYATILNDLAVFKHWVAWDAASAPMGHSLQPSHYGILYYSKDQKLNKFYEIRGAHKRCRKCNYLLKDYGGKKESLHPFGPLLSDVWNDIHRIRHKKNRDEHPCQLPVHLLERIILMSTDEGDIVFDPFVGTGTTAIAAKKLGRRYIGIDQNIDYVNLSKDKLEFTYSDSKIDNIWISTYLGKVITIRDKDWSELKCSFKIPDNLKTIDYISIKLVKNRDTHQLEIDVTEQHDKNIVDNDKDGLDRISANSNNQIFN